MTHRDLPEGLPRQWQTHLRVAGGRESPLQAPDITQPGVGHLSHWACGVHPTERGQENRAGGSVMATSTGAQGERLGDNGPSSPLPGWGQMPSAPQVDWAASASSPQVPGTCSSCPLLSLTLEDTRKDAILNAKGRKALSQGRPREAQIKASQGGPGSPALSWRGILGGEGPTGILAPGGGEGGETGSPLRGHGSSKAACGYTTSEPQIR